LKSRHPIDISDFLRGNAIKDEELSSETSSTGRRFILPKKKPKKPNAKVFPTN
jgi:hypothetical protein